MKKLPPGQNAIDDFPRFGLPQYANRFPAVADRIELSIGGDLESFEVTAELSSLDRINQTSDFHCVTTWSKVNLNWSGYSFNTFYELVIRPRLKKEVSFVVLKAQDGYKTSLPLSDLLNENVLLADRLDGRQLSLDHDAPIRIVAPDHYGYKSLKHLKAIEFYEYPQKIKQGLLSFMDHPRARVSMEERAKGGPALFFRWLYRRRINSTRKLFEEAAKKHKVR